MSTSIFDDKESMIEIWKQLRQEYYSAYELASNAVTRYYNLNVAIIPVYFVGLGLVFSEFMVSESMQIALLFSLGIFPIAIFGLARYGKQSMKDRSNTLQAIYTSIMKIQTIIGLDEHLKGEPLLSDDLPKVQVLSWGYSAFTYFGIAFAIINYALLVVQLLFLEGYAPV